MAKVGIVTDSIACVPQDRAREFGIGIIPLALSINGTPYRDQVDMTSDKFWKIFKDIKAFTTGAPPLAEFTRVFEEISQTTNNIACVFVSKGVSATYEAGVQARDLFKKEHPDTNIEVIDSCSGAGAVGFIAMEMAQAAEAGKTLSEVVQVANAMIPRVQLLIILETLKYLIKSGRAPKTAYAGELFQVKPVLGMVNAGGVVENLGRARGKEKALAKLIEIMAKYVDAGKPLHVNVHYTDQIEDGEELKHLVTSKFNCTEVYLTPYSPVMAGHTGPIISVSFYC